MPSLSETEWSPCYVCRRAKLLSTVLWCRTDHGPAICFQGVPGAKRKGEKRKKKTNCPLVAGQRQHPFSTRRNCYGAQPEGDGRVKSGSFVNQFQFLKCWPGLTTPSWFVSVDNDGCSSFKQHCSVTFQVSYRWKNVVSSANTGASLYHSRAKPAIN